MKNKDLEAYIVPFMNFCHQKAEKLLKEKPFSEESEVYILLKELCKEQLSHEDTSDTTR